MSLKYVSQYGNGCFIASAAMLTGHTYEEACRKLVPGYRPFDLVDAIKTDNPLETAVKMLSKLGCKARFFRSRSLKALKNKRMNALLIIRHPGDQMCHCVAYDAGPDTFLDPADGEPGISGEYMRYIRKNVESILVVESVRKVRKRSRVSELELAA